MEQNKEQKNTGNYLWKYEELQQTSLTRLKALTTSQMSSSISNSLSESDMAKFLASSYLETYVLTLDITLSTSLSRRSGISSWKLVHSSIYF